MITTIVLAAVLHAVPTAPVVFTAREPRGAPSTSFSIRGTGRAAPAGVFSSRGVRGAAASAGFSSRGIRSTSLASPRKR